MRLPTLDDDLERLRPNNGVEPDGPEPLPAAVPDDRRPVPDFDAFTGQIRSVRTDRMLSRRWRP